MKALRLALLASVVSCAMQAAIATAAGTPSNVVVVSAIPPATPSEVADAVMQRDTTRLQALLKAHGDVNAPQPDGSTALHWAAYEGDAHLAAMLLAAGARPNVKTDTGMTPLLLACEAGKPELVEELLRGGADPNQTLSGGETPLMMAARTGSVPVLKLLLARGASVDAREVKRGTTALMWAAANGNPEAVRFLLSKGADLTARSGTTDPGRRPYLAQTGRERIQEFVGGYGLAGRVEKQDGSPAAELAAAKLVAEQIATAKQVLAEHPLPKPPPPSRIRWGGLTPLMFATRQGDMATAKVLVESGADVNEVSSFGWTALLVATQNKYYKLGEYLLQHGAKPNLANGGGWTPLYIATDNRNIEGGDYPVRKPDMDHLDFIKELLAAGADPNMRMHSSTETRTVFTNQWLVENGATPFLRAAQSGDLVLMKLLLEHGADPSIATDFSVTPLMVASGIGWVEGVTYEWSPQETLETVKFLLDHGANVNAQDTEDLRTALMGAAHKGRNDVVELLVQHGADPALHDIGSRDTVHGLAGVSWQAIDYADGLVRVGVQSSIAHPETAALLRKMMKERGLAVPPEGRTLASICITDLCKSDAPSQAH
ncbi:MAG TPA: ankyrin repeat domain-containing protein [Steroidobacteraceae bacterium]|nr:ankyrin repeat domain-containing protein [Steroidobacteraceae bacterium]